MTNPSRVKKGNPINELRGEFEGFKKDMVVLEGKLSNIETEKENLRLVNQILIQKIKAVKNSDLPFKVCSLFLIIFLFQMLLTLELQS